jgi:group I intron endonuclease
MSYIIYEISCLVNRKVYIGFTSKSVENRFKQHIKDSRNKQDLRKFYAAIRKYGEHNFSYRVLDQSDDYEYTLNTLEQYYIDKFNSINEGYNTAKGGIGSPSTRYTRKVDIHDCEQYIKTFDSCVEADEFIGCPTGRVSNALSNWKKGKATKVYDYWISPQGKEPIRRVWDNKIMTEAARKQNKGRKRPAHSKFLKNFDDKTSPLYIIPEGEYRLKEAIEFYGAGMLHEWCRKNPNKVVTKMMIIKSRRLSLKDHHLWIGKTRAEIGFGYRLRV